MASYQFLDEKVKFTLKAPENYSYQYFPVAGENGIKRALTPNLGETARLIRTPLFWNLSAWKIYITIVHQKFLVSDRWHGKLVGHRGISGRGI